VLYKIFSESISITNYITVIQLLFSITLQMGPKYKILLLKVTEIPITFLQWQLYIGAGW